VPRGDARRVLASAALALLVPLTGGCSGEEDGRAEAQTRFECMQEAQAQASVEVVDRYVREGKLGTRSEIEREIEAVESPGFEPESFLDERGRVVPRARMTDDQRATFDAWKNTDEVQDVIGRAEQRALRLAREQARARCTADDS
jgi:hypothetical protein